MCLLKAFATIARKKDQTDHLGFELKSYEALRRFFFFF